MITGTFLAFALLLGYVVAVGLSLAATFTITSIRPDFVAKDHQIRRRYKFAQALLWLLCSAAGGYVTAKIAGTTRPQLAASSLAFAMILVLWINTWERRQRGSLHQTLLSLVSAAGVAAGCMLRVR